MPSRMLGRSPCPECGFESAHVKQAEGEGKRPYRYCPECGSQYYTRSDGQAAALMARTRAEGRAPAAAPAPAPSAAPAPAAPTAPPPAAAAVVSRRFGSR
jgi:hypothetical protein